MGRRSRDGFAEDTGRSAPSRSRACPPKFPRVVRGTVCQNRHIIQKFCSNSKSSAIKSSLIGLQNIKKSKKLYRRILRNSKKTFFSLHKLFFLTIIKKISLKQNFETMTHKPQILKEFSVLSNPRPCSSTSRRGQSSPSPATWRRATKLIFA